MCESNAYMFKNGQEELLLSSVATVDPVEGGFKLVGLFGEELEVSGKLKEINLLGHKIVFTDD